MAAQSTIRERPLVSVIVPARNEEVCLGACLQSLVVQTGVSWEIIVVDDGSTDRTREIAQSFPGVRVISAPPLPPGWVGKNNAVSAGAAKARGEWILFTDADTVHRPGSLARSVAEAQKRGVALLSYSPEQVVGTFWEKAVMPVVFAELASTYRPSEVSDPASSSAAANGQYILISREAYEAVGGYATIATNLLEDVALARAVKSSGRKIFFRFGGDAVRTRMYRNWTQLREGWTKNLTLLFPSLMRLAVFRATEFLLMIGGIVFAITSGLRGDRSLSLLTAALTLGLCSVFLKRIHRAHFPWLATVLSIIGLPVFSYLLLCSKRLYRKGGVTWKGRTYQPGSVWHYSSEEQGTVEQMSQPAVLEQQKKTGT